MKSQHMQNEYGVPLFKSKPMNVFVLNTGRCGSTTFIQACKHITNYTAAHESRSGFVGEAHFTYPENHIEADNRLSWFLGRLNKAYGDCAMYVHLRRNDDETARSFVKRYNRGIISAYRKTLLLGYRGDSDPMAVSLDYCDTVNNNIELFLKDKTNWMSFSLENAKEDFRKFWNIIGAEGDLESALSEFDIAYNASLDVKKKESKPLAVRVL